CPYTTLFRSKPSSRDPNQAAENARHCARLRWRYHGIFWVVVLIVSLPRWAMPTRFGIKIVGYRCVYFPSPGRGERGETTHPRSCINCWASAFSSGRYFSSTGPNGLRHSGTETTSI